MLAYALGLRALVVGAGLLFAGVHGWQPRDLVSPALVVPLIVLVGWLPARKRTWWAALFALAVAPPLAGLLIGSTSRAQMTLLVLAQLEVGRGRTGRLDLRAMRAPLGIALAQLVAVLGTDLAGDGLAGNIAPALAWLLMGAAVGVDATSGDPEAAGDPRWQRARHLVSELDDVINDLSVSLDAETAARALLDECDALAPVQVGAVLRAGSDERLVPVAFRGSARIPWSRPLSQPGPLASAWAGGTPVREVRHPDRQGKRRGNVLLVVPLAVDGERLGLLVLDSRVPGAFPDRVVDQIAALATSFAPRLAASIHFDDLRRGALHDERARLAQDMHDGIAQTVVAIGFEVDRVRRRLEREYPEAVADLKEVRSVIDTLSHEVRVSMIDLRTGLGPWRGLATSVAAYLRSVAGATGIRVSLDLQDSGFRLPGAVEEACYRLLHACFIAANEAHATQFSVRLVIDPPSVLLRLATDAPGCWGDIAIPPVLAVTSEVSAGRQIFVARSAHAEEPGAAPGSHRALEPLPAFPADVLAVRP